jgi:hypothetical protein
MDERSNDPVNEMASMSEPSRPHLSGYVDTCKNCGTTAPADGMGLCSNPKCRAVRKGAKLAARHGPINTDRRKELRESFIRDYRPATTIDEIRCKQLASIAERLEVVKTGPMDHMRLVQTSQMLTTALEESRQARVQLPTESNLERLSDDHLLARLEGLLNKARELARLKAEGAERTATDEAGTQEAATSVVPAAIQDGPVQVPLANEATDPGREEREQQLKLDEQREIRRKLGWDVGVLNEQSGYRHRE